MKQPIKAPTAPNQLKKLVNDSKLWDSFLKELEKGIEFSRVRLEQAKEIDDVRSAQGEIRAYRKLKQLREKVNNEK